MRSQPREDLRCRCGRGASWCPEHQAYACGHCQREAKLCPCPPTEDACPSMVTGPLDTILARVPWSQD